VTDVFVIAPIRVYREMLSRVLNNAQGLRAVGSEPTVAEALPRLRELRPDVALLDASVPDVPLVPPPTAEPEVKFVALGVPETEAVAWVEAGVSGYVSQGASFEDLELAVRRVARGQLVTSPEVAGYLLDRIRRLSAEASEAATKGRLTPREREVLDLVGEGLSNKLIARRLSIQEQTVKNHVHSILLKLGVERRAEAVARMRGSRRRLSDR
jgi:two-component system, NarL family, nitrate/nitrite response regulator NarL